MNPPDWRERILELPLWAVVLLVAASGFVVGAVVAVAMRHLQQGALAGVSLLAQIGAFAIPMMTIFTVFKWLVDTLIVWIAVRVTGSLSGDPFRVGFLEGYRHMLPITMLMVANSSLALLVSAVTGFWLLLIVAWFIDLLILRTFLEMDWYEVFLLNAVLGFLSLITGGLL